MELGVQTWSCVLVEDLGGTSCWIMGISSDEELKLYRPLLCSCLSHSKELALQC